MIHKITSLLLVLTLCCSLFSLPTYAMEGSFQELRNEVKATSLGKKILPQVDTLLPRLSEEQLDKMWDRIDELYWQEDISADQELIFEYISLAIEQELDARHVVHIVSTLGAEEQKKIEAQLSVAQKVLTQKLVKTLEAAMFDWNNASYYTDMGNLSIDFDMDLGAIGSLDSGLKLSDYTIKNAVFDQQLKAQVDGFVKATMQGEDIDVQVKSLLDFISKDGNIYLLAEKLEVSLGDNGFEEEFGEIITQLKELAQTKTYLSFTNEENEDLFKMLQGINPETIASEIAKSAETPWFHVTGKEADSYTLVPSKAFCTMMKQALSVFDPFSGDTCTNTQYQDMIDDLENAGTKILYNIGANSSLRIIEEDEGFSTNIDLIWNNAGIVSLSGQGIENENPKNKLSFAFFPNESFEFGVQAEDIMTLQLAANLSDTGSLESLSMKGDIEDIDMQLDYKNDFLSFAVKGESMPGENLSCTGSGPMTASTFALKASCDINSSGIEMLVLGSNGNLKLDIQASGDVLAGKNNYSFSLGAEAAEKEILSLDIKNTGTRSIDPNITITAPTKTIEFESAVDEMYDDEIYDDEIYDDEIYEIEE